jgi:hypothetical protein
MLMDILLHSTHLLCFLYGVLSVYNQERGNILYTRVTKINTKFVRNETPYTVIKVTPYITGYIFSLGNYHFLATRLFKT